MAINKSETMFNVYLFSNMKIEKVKVMMRYGDYATLARMLEINPEAAKMRFLRHDDTALAAMIIIVESRETLIADFIKKKRQDR